jgi:hypothetical protein
MTELEQRLSGLAGGYPFPETPDLAGATRARIMPARRPRPAFRLAVAFALVALAAAGALALSSTARSGLVDLLDLVPGVRIERVAEPPTMAVTESATLGVELPLAEAERTAAFELLLPRSLGAPDRVYRRSSGAVTALYGDDRRARVVLTAWPADMLLAHKMIGPGTAAEVVDVRGQPGVWLSGVPHPVFYLDDGLEHGIEGNLAGNVLVWQEGDTAYRLESGLTLERALELADDLA